MTRIFPYIPADDVAIVTSYFNPSEYTTKQRNYSLFLEPFRRSGIPCLTIECGFPGRGFTLPADDCALRVDGRDVMWQKERLLNLVLPRLPASCSKVIWLDCDVLFANPDWIIQASRALDKFAVIQPYSSIIRLPRGCTPEDEQPGEIWQSFARVAGVEPNAVLTGDFHKHGHTGFAWGMRRDIFSRHGLYDGCIAGSADHMMAHAFVGDWSGRCIQRIFGGNSAHLRHFQIWASKVYPDIRARIGCVPGEIFHLWHGNTADRHYVDRNRELAGFRFDPTLDIRVGASGCWEWASKKPDLHAWARRYFDQRREDGNQEAGMLENPPAVFAGRR